MASPGAITAVLEGIVETAANIAEHSGGVLGTQEAKTLSYEITALGAYIPSIKATMEEHPYLAVIGIGLGVGAGVLTAPALAEASTAFLTGLGITIAEQAIVSTIAQVVAATVISNGVEGFVEDVGKATSLGQLITTVTTNAAAWNAGTLVPTDIATPTDINIWGQNPSATETYDDYSNTGVLLGSVTLNSTTNTTSMTSISGSYALIAGPTNYTQSFGNGLVINATKDTVSVGKSTLVTVTGDDNTVNAVSGGNIDFNGTSGAFNASGAAINAAAGSNFTLSGSNNTISLDAASYLGLLSGTGETVLATDAQIVTLGGTGINVSGSSNTISLSGSHDYLGILSGTANTVFATDANVTTLGGVAATLVGSGNDLGGGSSVAFTISGSNNMMALGPNSYLGLVGGTGNTVLATNDHIVTLGGTGINVSGSDNAISLVGGAAYLGVLSGTDETIAASNDQIVALGGVGLSVGGNGNSISLVGSNSNLTLANGTGEIVAASNDQIVTGNNVSLSVGGANNSITLGASNDLTLSGTEQTVTANSADLITGAGTSLDLFGNTNSIGLAANSTLLLDGTGNLVNGMAVGTSVTSGITDTVTTNPDDSWIETINDSGNTSVNWTEEQFAHAVNDQVEEETIKYTDGSSMVQYWNINQAINPTTWSTEIRDYNSSHQLTIDTVDNRDGTSIVTDYSNTVDETYFYAPGSYGPYWAAIVFTAVNGQEINTFGNAVEFLDTGQRYSNDWYGGSFGSNAGDGSIDDFFSSTFLSDTDTFNPNLSLEEGLSPLPTDLTGFDLTNFDDQTTYWGIVDPIVINLAGQSVTTTAEGSNGVTFDMLGNGSQQSTGWVTANEGFLVFDKTDASQIVSSHNLVSDLNELTALNGGSSQIAAADPLYSDLAIWIPSDPGTPGQLETLTEAGITAINLAATTTDIGDNGNTINATFGLIFSNGSTGQGADVSFAVGSAPSMQFITGSAPDETLTGTSGPDEFVLNGAATGTQTIAGFKPGQDVIDLIGGQFGSLAAVEAAVSGVNGGTVIDMGHGGSLLLPGVDPTTLHAANFAFAT